MRVERSGLGWIAVSSVAAMLCLVAVTSDDTPASAQCNGGEYTLIQGGTVGWVRVNADRTVEWWAYIDGEYAFGDTGSIGVNKWQLEAEYVGTGNWASYAAWKADVVQRSAAQGHAILFQQHSVTEELVND